MQSLNLAVIVTLVGIGLSACGSERGGSTGTATPLYGAPSPTPPRQATSSGDSTLTVMNFLNWCSVAINDGAASTDATVTAAVRSGSVATIVATPASGSFEIGANPWFGVDENDGGAAAGVDVGSGVSETSTATVTATGTAQCVSVCCQEPGNSPIPCPTANPCQ